MRLINQLALASALTITLSGAAAGDLPLPPTPKDNC
jgi:hypothetical protein